VKAAHSVGNLAKMTFGAKHTAVKLIILAVLGFIAFVVLYKTPYGVRAPFQLVALQKHVVSAPFEGIIDQIFVKPGQPVTEGQPLMKLKTTDLELKLLQSKAEAQAERTRALGFRNERKASEAKAAEHKADALDAAVAVYQYDIDRATVKSPTNGVVLRGDLFDHRGAPVKQGDALFEIGEGDKQDPTRLAVEAEVLVNERDIQEVKRLHEEQKYRDLAKQRGFDGKLSTSSFPNKDHEFHIKRIVPSGDPKDGENVFKVYVDVEKPEEWMHPGLAGEARVEMDKRSLAWIYTHRLGDWLRLKRWHWMP
jgi:biotin carboxyl carrier protein